MKVIDAKGKVLLEVTMARAHGLDAKGFKDVEYNFSGSKEIGVGLGACTVGALQMMVDNLQKEYPGSKVEGTLPEPVFKGKGVELKFQGRSFKDDGITITPDAAVGYPKFPNGDYRGAIGEMCDGEGNVIGTCKVTTKWRTPKSHISSHQYQIEATIAGIRYTGRSGGNGMLWRGKRVA